MPVCGIEDAVGACVVSDDTAVLLDTLVLGPSADDKSVSDEENTAVYPEEYSLSFKVFLHAQSDISKAAAHAMEIILFISSPFPNPL